MATNINFIDFSPLTPITADWLNNVNSTVNYTYPGGTLRTLNSKLSDWASLKDFGAKIDGVTDDTVAVNAALNSGVLNLYFPPGTCLISSTLFVNKNFQQICGAGNSASTFLMTAAAGPAIQVAGFFTGVTLRDFAINRSVPPTSTGHGINWLSSTSESLIENVIVQNCQNAFNLCPTDYSKVVRCVALQNYAHGWYFTNIGSAGPCQWSISDCLASANNGNGMFIDGTSGTGGISLGEIVNFSTFANGGFGILAAGSAANPISGLRITGGFLGQDGNSELFMDTFGAQHKIIGTEIELCGTGPTGRNGLIAASHTGHGILISANNPRVQIGDININGCSDNGITTAGGVVSIGNPQITSNGQAGLAGAQLGISISAGRVMIVGGYISDASAGSQQVGVGVGTGAVAHITGTDMTGNIASATSGSGTIVTSNTLP